MSHLRVAHIPDAGATDVERSVRVTTAATILDCHPCQVRKLLAAGELRGHRIGKRGVRVYVWSIEAYQRGRALGNEDAKPGGGRPQGRRRRSASLEEALAHLRAIGVL